MADAKLYSAQDIENLKQKIAAYRDTLTTLKSGNTIDDYLFMKNELNGFKMQALHSEELMGKLNDERSMQIEEYEQQIEHFSQQISTLNQTVEELNKDLSAVMDQLINTQTENVVTSVAMPESVDTKHNAVEMDLIIEDTIQLEDRTPLSSIRQSNRPPSFKYMQNLVEKAIDIQEIPSTAMPIASFDQTPGKPSFPSIGSQPNQIYNGPNRNINKQSAIRFNGISTNQAIPTRKSDNLVASTSQLTTETEKNEVVLVPPEEVNPIATIEHEAKHIEKIEKVNEGVHHVEKVEREMRPTALIELPIEMKRQQHKNKETLTLFNFFRKKS